MGWRLRAEDARAADAEMATARAYAGLIQSLMPVIVIASLIQLVSLTIATIIWAVWLLYVAAWFARSVVAHFR